MDIPTLLSATEGENIEFKEAKNRFDFEELVQYACAIANCGGGKIVLGVADRRPREVVGSQAFPQPERTRKGLMDRLHIHIDFMEAAFGVEKDIQITKEDLCKACNGSGRKP